jgi:hypothetical protein
MIKNSKILLISWWIIIVISFLLWYRNLFYDRIFSVFSIFLGLLVLIFYGLANNMRSDQGITLIIIILSIQIFTLICSAYIIYRDWILLCGGIVTLILLPVISLLSYNQESIVPFMFIYTFALIFVYYFLFSVNNNIIIVILFIYSIGSIILVVSGCIPYTSYNMWSYLFIGFVFLIYILGIFCEFK